MDSNNYRIGALSRLHTIRSVCFAIHMDSIRVTAGIRDRVAVEMVSAGVSKRALSIASGIPLTTLDRKLRSGDFTARELAMLAEALRVPFARLIPQELRSEESAA